MTQLITSVLCASAREVAPAPRPCGPRRSERRKDLRGAVLRSGSPWRAVGAVCRAAAVLGERGRVSGVTELRQVTAACGAASGGAGHAGTAVIPVFPPPGEGTPGRRLRGGGARPTGRLRRGRAGARGAEHVASGGPSLTSPPSASSSIPPRPYTAKLPFRASPRDPALGIARFEHPFPSRAAERLTRASPQRPAPGNGHSRRGGAAGVRSVVRGSGWMK